MGSWVFFVTPAANPMLVAVPPDDCPSREFMRGSCVSLRAQSVKDRKALNGPVATPAKDGYASDLLRLHCVLGCSVALRVSGEPYGSQHPRNRGGFHVAAQHPFLWAFVLRVKKELATPRN